MRNVQPLVSVEDAWSRLEPISVKAILEFQECVLEEVIQVLKDHSGKEEWVSAKVFLRKCAIRTIFTMWKLHNFSVIQILREIKFSRSTV